MWPDGEIHWNLLLNEKEGMNWDMDQLDLCEFVHYRK